eukprot:scaffold10653_cov175-Amphora_coffeaeformis.AAC.10
MAATDQIRQMVNFILQEAHEKANEIRVKVSRANNANRCRVDRPTAIHIPRQCWKHFQSYT